MGTNKKKNLPMCGMISLPAGISKRMIKKGKKLFYLEKVENRNNRRYSLAKIPDRQE